jgi:hypothetical protein
MMAMICSACDELRWNRGGADAIRPYVLDSMISLDIDDCNVRIVVGVNGDEYHHVAMVSLGSIAGIVGDYENRPYAAMGR